MGDRKDTLGMDERTITMKDDYWWLLIAMFVAAGIGAAAMWNIDYHNYHATVNELMTKCGEPCL
jgi:hypothetical protein